MITNKDKNEIKDLIKEVLEENRIERIEAHTDHFIIGVLGGFFFSIFLVIAALFSFGFIGGIILGIGTLIDAGIIWMLVDAASDVRKEKFEKNSE